jgi:hypothetical protein
MVLSVLAMGMAGFAGSAAALTEQTDSNGDPISGTAGGLVVSDPADPGATGATHTITVLNESSGDNVGFGATNVDNITITYDDDDALGSYSSSTDLSNSDITVSIGGQSLGNSGESISINNGNQIEITGLDSAGSPQSLDAGESIQVVLSNVDNPDSTTDVTVNARNTTGSSSQISSTQTLELPGAVERYDDQRSADGTPDGNFTTIGDALSAADQDDYINIGDGEYREFGNDVAPPADNITLAGAGADSRGGRQTATGD